MCQIYIYMKLGQYDEDRCELKLLVVCCVSTSKKLCLSTNI